MQGGCCRARPARETGALLDFGLFTVGECFLLVQHELLLFAAVFFLAGAIDEIAMDGLYAWFRLNGRIGRDRISQFASDPSFTARAAIFIPAWQESSVIATTLRHARAAWPWQSVRIYVGCYRNDAATLASAMIGARGDARVRVVIHDRDGPTNKADCLNRLHSALCEDERRSCRRFDLVAMHDAEDMVDPAALPLMAKVLCQADFVQLPVLALPQRGSRWIAGHYSDEFAEVHGKTMVVRDALGAALPGAGVGCAIARDTLSRLAERGEPFATGSLTEDYELGLEVAALGGRSRFVRVIGEDGRLIATRSYFPAQLDDAVRQKTRWVHGVALQGWDRLGWRGGIVDLWMQMRDRRGPFAALLLGLGYLLVVMSGIQIGLAAAGIAPPIRLSSALEAILWANLAALGWRAIMRGIFTSREFGWREGLFALPRIFVSNIIAIMAGRRAVTAYLGTLRGHPVRWDKTDHRDHPAMAGLGEATA